MEGFFEVFATTVIAFIFMRLKLVRPGVAASAALLSATIFLSGGIIGTCHHLYFSGTPTVALAWGSVFSALEVVPLCLVGFDAMADLRRSKSSPWVQRYKWPIYFFVAVAFWNMVGAGLFGFMINPPIALYYMQGLNTTPLHAHAALFGVYGMLGIGLMLLCLRVLVPGRAWERRLAAAVVLGIEWRLAGDVCAEFAAGGVDADVGVGRTRVLVCTKQRVHADRSHANPALDAHARRHGIFRGSRCPRGVRRRTENRAFISTIGVRPLSAAPHPAHGAKNQLELRLSPLEDRWLQAYSLAPRELGSIRGVVVCTNPREIQNHVLHAQPARRALSVLTPFPWTGPAEYLARTTQTRPASQQVLCPTEVYPNLTSGMGR